MYCSESEIGIEKFPFLTKWLRLRFKLQAKFLYFLFSYYHCTYFHILGTYYRPKPFYILGNGIDLVKNAQK